MPSISISMTWTQVDETHLLVHLYHRKIINDWMLIDLDELAKRHGLSLEEVIKRLRERVQ